MSNTDIARRLARIRVSVSPSPHTAEDILKRYYDNPVQIVLKYRALQGLCVPEIGLPINTLRSDTKLNLCKCHRH